MTLDEILQGNIPETLDGKTADRVPTRDDLAPDRAGNVASDRVCAAR